MATAKTAEKPQTTAAPKQAPTGNLPAQQQQQQKPLIVQFRDYVQQRMATLEDALPPTIPPKRFVSVVMTALQTKPQLLACTFPSLWNACIRAAQDGLLPDGREGAIAPYGEKADGKKAADIATWMPMIEGYRKKVFEAGGVLSWEVNVVYEKDQFDYELGDNAFIQHKPYIGRDDSGGIVGAYSRAKLANGEVVREVMSAFQIMQVKNKSKAANGPWSDQQAFPEMCKKTVARRHYKQLPHSESMDAMLAREDQENGFADPEATPIARPERRQLSARNVMDHYAGDGDVIDNETGEVTSGHDRGDTGRGTAEQLNAADRVADGGGKVVKDRDGTANNGSAGASAAAAEGGAASSASAASPSNNTSTADDASPGGGAGEAGAAGATPSAPASDASDEMPEDDAVDGADRPWPPGAAPTNPEEYERYLKTKLASITDASKVAPFFNSAEEKELRVKCECATKFKELQDLAIARRKELTPANERR